MLKDKCDTIERSKRERIKKGITCSKECTIIVYNLKNKIFAAFILVNSKHAFGDR